MHQSRYLPALTGVRALAAFWVLLYYLHPTLRAYFGDFGFVSAVIMMGYQGVDLFFGLSGFIIAHHYAEKLRVFSWAGYRDYLWARIARVYPLHLVMLMTVLLLVKAAPLFGFTINRGTDYLWSGFFKNLLLVQAWEFPARVNWNHFAWSISAEWFAYLLAPLFVALIWARQRVFSLIGLGTDLFNDRATGGHIPEQFSAKRLCIIPHYRGIWRRDDCTASV